ncbi:MAG: hypothetical protein ACLFUI_02055 [Halanaerobiales bacterium]
MKKQGIILFSLLFLLMVIVLAGCSVMGDMHSTGQDLSAAYVVVEQFERGIADGDSNLLENSISQQGFTLITETGEYTYSRNEAASVFNVIEYEQNVIFDISNKVANENGSTVVVKGKLKPLLPEYTDVDIDDGETQSLSSTNTNKPMIDLMAINDSFSQKLANNDNDLAALYDGTNFNIEYPGGWMIYYLTTPDEEWTISFSDNYMVSLVLWKNNELVNVDLDEYIASIIDQIESYEDQEAVPRLDNVSYSVRDIILDNYPGVEFTLNVDCIYHPVVVEVTLELEGDSYYITKVEMARSDEVDVMPFQEMTNYINADDDLYMVSFMGTKAHFNSAEAYDILDTFEVIR